MKAVRGVLGWLAVAIIAVVGYTLTAHDGAAQVALHGPSLLTLGAMGALRVWGEPLTKQELEAMAQPESRKIESFPYIFYDSQTYAQAGAANVNFFTALNADPTITNMAAAGQWPSPQWFQIFGFCITFMAAGPSNITAQASGTNNTGLVNDLDLITKTQRAIFNFSVSQKVYAQWPVLALHGLGGAQAFLTLGSTTLNQQYGNNGPVDGGFGHQGELVIPPNTGFTCSLQLSAAQAITVATVIQVAMIGRFYRKVL